MASLGLAATLPQKGLLAITWVGTGLAACLIVARTVIRLKKIKRLMVDDYFMYAAFTVLVVNAILQTMQAPHAYKLSRLGAGLEEFDADMLASGNLYVRYEFTIIGLFWTVLWLVKGSFLAFFYRLFDGLPAYRRAWWGVVLFAFGAYVGCWILSINVCHPPSNYFIFGACTKDVDKRTSTMSVLYSTVVDVLTDLMIMALPMNLLWKVRISRSEKQGLAFVFCIGFLIIIFAIVRAIQIAFTSTSDAILLALWGIIESTVAVIVGCLPPFKSLFARPSVTTNANSSDYRKQYGFSNELRNGSIPLKSRTTHSARVRSSRDPREEVRSESMEDILTTGRGDFSNKNIMVQRDIEISSSTKEIHDSHSTGSETTGKLSKY